MFNASVKVNTKQKIILFDEMTRNSDILDGRRAEFGTRRSRNELWEKLAAKLNTNGPEKDITQWKKCWSDLRLGMRKKYQAKKKTQYKGLTENEKRIMKACGIQYGEGEDTSESTSDSDVMEVIDEAEIKLEQPDTGAPIVFEIVDVQSETIISDIAHPVLNDDYTLQGPMNGVIKIEDPPLSPQETEHEPNSVYPPNHDTQSTKSSQKIFPGNNLSSTGIENFSNEAIIEIRKMHHNLLRESKKQTALLRKLVRSLSHQ